MTGAAAWRAFSAQARIELILASRRLESLLVTLAVPVVLLGFMATLRAPSGAPPFPLTELVPRVLAVAVIGTGLVSLGIATAYERGYGVLKRLAGSPLPMWALLASKALTVAVTVAAQVAIVIAAGVALGWSPAGGPLAAVALGVPWLLLGLVVFAALGLLLAGTLRPEAVLAAANGLYLAFILLGGVIVPVAQLPDPIAAGARLMPPALFASALSAAMAPGSASGGADPIALGALLAWGVLLGGAAVLAFRVD